jgi:hypothetical protein
MKKNTNQLVLADDFALPLEAVTESMAILAVRGAGKSNAANVLAREMYQKGLHWIAIDPKGDWWGIRASRDGKEEGGLPIPIFGGSHGDLPLDPLAGAALARFLVEHRVTCILDVSHFNSEAEKVRFLLAFSEQLFRSKNEAQEPTHIFFEEADDYIPQNPFPEQRRLVHAMAKILKQGRSRGLGGTIISQRTAVVHKDVLSQVQTLFALRTTSPHDRKAIQNWVSFFGENNEMVKELPSLKDGEAWVWSPNWLRVMRRVQFHRRATFDSGATPKPGSSKRAPTTLATVDLEVLRQLLSGSLQKAAEDDPAALKAKVKKLEQELTKKTAALPVDPKLEQLNRKLEHENRILRAQNAELRDYATRTLRLKEMLAQLPPVPKLPVPVAIGRMQSTQPNTQNLKARVDEADVVLTPVKGDRKEKLFIGTGVTTEKLGRTEREVLTISAQFADQSLELTKELLGVYLGKHPNGKGVINSVGALRSAGYLDKLAITAEGREALGAYDSPPTGEELFEWYVTNKLSPAQERLARIISSREDWTKASLAAELNVHPNGKTFINNLGRLRSLKVVEGLRLSPRMRNL